MRRLSRRARFLSRLSVGRVIIFLGRANVPVLLWYRPVICGRRPLMNLLTGLISWALVGRVIRRWFLLARVVLRRRVYIRLMRLRLLSTTRLRLVMVRLLWLALRKSRRSLLECLLDCCYCVTLCMYRNRLVLLVCLLMMVWLVLTLTLCTRGLRFRMLVLFLLSPDWLRVWVLKIRLRCLLLIFNVKEP